MGIVGGDNLDSFYKGLIIEEESQCKEPLLPQFPPLCPDEPMNPCPSEVSEWMADPPSNSVTRSLSSDSSPMDQSCPSEEDTRSQEALKGPGRPTNPLTILLRKLRNLRKPFNVPKKENLYIQLIRGFKRAIREVESNHIPRTKIHGFEKKDLAALKQWNQFCELVLNNTRLYAIARVTSGPITEGKNSRSMEEKGKFKSFNEEYCGEFFEDEQVRKAFQCYLDLVFVSNAEDDLSKKFKFSPISETKEGRNDVWTELKGYLCQRMFEDLGLGESDEPT